MSLKILFDAFVEGFKALQDILGETGALAFELMFIFMTIKSSFNIILKFKLNRKIKKDLNIKYSLRFTSVEIYSMQYFDKNNNPLLSNITLGLFLVLIAFINSFNFIIWIVIGIPILNQFYMYFKMFRKLDIQEPLIHDCFNRINDNFLLWDVDKNIEKKDLPLLKCKIKELYFKNKLDFGIVLEIINSNKITFNVKERIDREYNKI